MYETLPGWQSSTEGVRAFSDLPPNAQAYIKKIQQIVEVPGKLFFLPFFAFYTPVLVKWIGVGKGRESIIQLY